MKKKKIGQKLWEKERNGTENINTIGEANAHSEHIGICGERVRMFSSTRTHEQ